MKRKAQFNFVKGKNVLAQKYAALLDLWNILCLETWDKMFIEVHCLR